MEFDAAPGTLFAVLKERRDQLISSWGDRIKGLVSAAGLPRAELLDHMPSFVDEIIAALYPDALPLPRSSASAEEHGEQRLRLGFDVGEVVREYGALHECILQVASEAGHRITEHDNLLVVKWLNGGIADAVVQYTHQRDLELQRQESEHLGFIAHELRNPLGLALLAFQRLQRTELAESRTAEMLDRSLRRTSDMISSVLTHAALRIGVEPRLGRIALRSFLAEIEAEAEVQAQAKRLTLSLDAPEELIVDADERLLRSAVSNLVHNALKFSQEGARIEIRARIADSRLLIEVADGCGGLPAGQAEELFAPLVQRSDNRSGFGLGLSIALQAAEAHHGTIKVRDVPGTGCTFTIDLPYIVRSGTPSAAD